MKKIFSCFMYCFILIPIIHSQNFSKNGHILSLNNLYYDINLSSDLKFTNGKIIIRDYEKGRKEDNYIFCEKKIVLKNESKISFLISDDGDKYLLLANPDILVMYDKSSKCPIIFGTNLSNGSELITYIDSKTVKASSELKENNYIYSAKNICNLNINEPWVEGMKNNGIGEEIQFIGNCSIMYFFNGFISFEKPYLYNANSRIKKILLSFPDEIDRTPITVELEDTPNPQKINLGFRCKSLIKIKILEVYNGNKYDDACLHGILLKVY